MAASTWDREATLPTEQVHWAPGSNLIWLRPGDEAELLASLADAGVVAVSELD